MASIVLSGVGAAIGGMVAGPLGAQIGYGLGSITGNALQPGKQNYKVSGARMADLSIQTSTYGKSIPILFGQSRFAGNVIWSLPIQEHEHRSDSAARGKGGGGRRTKVTNIYYTYSITLAIAICEGVIDEIINIWADAKNITNEISDFSIYKGDENQMPDSRIESHVGVGRTPAYRGLAYIVIEDFYLGDYGNRIPNFTFEVRRKSRSDTKTLDLPVEDKLRAINIIPGSGEFVYDTQIQYKVNKDSDIQNGKAKPINMNNLYGKADSLVSLDQLQNTCKNLKWVSPVVGWFVTSLNLAECLVEPGVEFRENLHTTPDEWYVAGKTRKEAHQITLKDGLPIYGGTTSDNSVIRYLDELKSRGLKIMFYPMLFVDKEDKPWRGHITGNASDVENFFTKKNGYNEFILHYARLVRGKVDAFLIGSEFKKITSIRDNKNEYPAVRCLIELARQVKVILGSNVHISYAADWSEYHHDNLGYFYMDDLWSSQYIDFVGIDAYFPLTDNYAEVLEEGDVIKGWDSGELYDYYYNDKNSKFKLSPKYALKNIEYWWNSHHFNPDKTKTNWKPKSKKIWFTEFGFPSVDGCANQPNVFFDPESYDGGLPKGSKGIIDFYSQRVAINATIKRWEKSNIVENLFLWTWDARPYPSWPSFSQVWGDGNKWDKGHWVNGKFGLSLLSDVLYELCKRSGIDVKQIDTSKIIDVVDGFVIDEVVAAQDVIELLSRFYFFDVQESDGLLKFISPKSFGNHVINSSELIYNFNNNLIQIIHQDEEGLPKKIELIYSDKSKLYNQNVSRAQNYHTSSDKHLLLASNIVFSERLISKKAKELLQQIWNARHLYKIKLPFKYMFLRPGDIITLNYQDSLYHIKVSTISIIENKCLEIEGNSYIIGVCNSQYDPADIQINQENISTECNYISYALDLPARIGEFKEYNNINIAVAAKSGTFKPASIYFFYNNSYHYVTDVIKESTVGSVHDRLRDANYSIFDTENTINVSLISGSLESVSDDQILSKANMAIIGDEIVQFKNAQLVSENLYKLSVFLRGRMGTESFTDSHQPGERFILLDKNLTSVDISMQLLGFESDYFLVSDGEKLDLTENNRFTWNANSLKPLSPVHLFYEEISNEKVKISWTRRSRIGGTMRNNVDIMLHEEKECYEIDCITKLGNIDTVIRSQPYIVLDQKYFSNLSMVKVFQISGVVGRGFGSELKIQ